MNEKMLMEVIRAQQETIRILQEHIKRLTRPVAIDPPFISSPKDLTKE